MKQEFRPPVQKSDDWKFWFWLMVIAAFVGFIVFSGTLSTLFSIITSFGKPPFQTTVGSQDGYQARLEAVYRLQDAHDLRMSVAPDRRNLGGGEVVFTYTDGSPKVAYPPVLIWGQDGPPEDRNKDHSERVALEQDILPWLQSTDLTGVVQVHILIYSQFPVCTECKSNIRDDLNQIVALLKQRAPQQKIKVTYAVFELTKYGTGGDKSTWKRPVSVDDVQQVKIP